MSIKVFAEGNTLRVIDCSGEMPQGREIELFTSEEIEKLAAQRIWQSMSKESREDMLFQTQSKSYQEWMKEDEWDMLFGTLPKAVLNADANGFLIAYAALYLNDEIRAEALTRNVFAD